MDTPGGATIAITRNGWPKPRLLSQHPAAFISRYVRTNARFTVRVKRRIQMQRYLGAQANYIFDGPSRDSLADLCSTSPQVLSSFLF